MQAPEKKMELFSSRAFNFPKRLENWSKCNTTQIQLSSCHGGFLFIPTDSLFRCWRVIGPENGLLVLGPVA